MQYETKNTQINTNKSTQLDIQTLQYAKATNV